MSSLFIGGKWQGASEGGKRVITCPADGKAVASVDEGVRADTLMAIDAARVAFDSGPWRHAAPDERAEVLLRVAALLEKNKAHIARAESLDTGKRYIESKYDVDDVVACFRYYADAARVVSSRRIDTGNKTVESTVTREPIGVCGLITPWNFPLLQAAWKVAPCLAAGNSFVLKPSELTPHSSIMLVEALEEAGVPDGVANLVLGTGPEVGAPLAEHPDVDLLSFTGGLATGQHLMRECAATVKKVALELGGKNPNIVFADACFESSLDYALTAVFLDSGQVCSAGTRLLIERGIHDQFVDELVGRASRIRMGGPFDPNAETGPLISGDHLAKVHQYVRTGVQEGARLRCGGGHPDDPALRDGYFYPPTILDDCRSDMTVVQEESFGPVLTVETFETPEEALALANATVYGLAGGVWTGDPAKAQYIAKGLRAGTVWINDFHPYVPQAEWGGFKRSGIGRELGALGLDEYCETKHIWNQTAPSPQHWFGGSTPNA